MAQRPRVAIACQGGGSHAAFAAGVLIELLGTDARERFDLVALSGTSGGAVCATLAWAGLIRDGPRDACERLAGFWADLKVRDFADAIVNFWGLWLARLPVSAEVSPYLYEPIAERTLRSLLGEYVDLDGLAQQARDGHPKLLVGATDIESGDRLIFTGEKLTYDEIIASAAVPPIFRAARARGRLCWDGLFSTNPPVRELTDLVPRPDEIWVVQINPRRREGEPRSMRDIIDRRNELAGNLSLAQELHFIDRVNALVAEHAALRERYRHITLRVVELALPDLDYPSKLDRSERLIERLIAHGRERAGSLLRETSVWRRDGSLPADAVVGAL